MSAPVVDKDQFDRDVQTALYIARKAREENNVDLARLATTINIDGRRLRGRADLWKKDLTCDSPEKILNTLQLENPVKEQTEDRIEYSVPDGCRDWRQTYWSVVRSDRVRARVYIEDYVIEEDGESIIQTFIDAEDTANDILTNW